LLDAPFLFDYRTVMAFINETPGQPFAIVLAGGRSSRMGQPKAMMRLEGTTVLNRIVGELRPLFSTIMIAAAPAEVEPFPIDISGVTVVRDDTAFAGPVGAIASALSLGPGGHAFVCSCDLPFIRAAVVREILSLRDRYDAVIPFLDGKLQMLHAVYDRRCAGLLREMQSRGISRLSSLASMINTRIVGEAELRRIDPELESFFNLNTPADYDRAREILQNR
jgi:molybdopterin-guanine dinucleotide biosynthesis protein A